MGNDLELRGSADAVVVGGGVIGLAIARELSAAGLRVTIVERGQLGREASYAAAGMLAPQAEANERDSFFELARASRAIYPAFAAELLEETGVDVELDETGTLYLGFTDTDVAEIERRYAWQSAADLPVERLSPEEARRCEPHISPALCGALLFPNDAQIENRHLVHALAASCAVRGVELLTSTEVVEIETTRDGARVQAVTTSRGRITTPLAIVASGAWASQLCIKTAAHDSLPHLSIEPVRGQILCLEASPTFVRHVIYSPRAYLVPRRDGRLLIGATTEHAGFDACVTLDGLHTLTRDALEISPHTGDLQFLDAWAGLRPRAPDGLPIIGRSSEISGLIFATGHYRNGILLAPLTARLVRDLVLSPDAAPESLRAFSPNRFADVGSIA